MTDNLIKGADLSTLLEVEECGGRFFDEGAEGDAMRILKDHGIGLVRLRLWNDPRSADGEPYGAGTCSLERVMRLAERAKSLGLPWMLDFHYSDFWADPGKQFLPKAWQGLDAPVLEEAVYGYTCETLDTLRQAGLLPACAAVGNEVTNGLLWPIGRRPQDAEMVRLLGSGIRAVRAAAPETAVMLHLDNGGNNALYRDWFGAYRALGGEDFDMIGLSYYPYWHGSLEDLRQNLHWLAEQFHKPLLVAETSIAFTYDSYDFLYDKQGTWRCIRTESASVKGRKPLAAGPELGKNLPWPGTPEGQDAFLRELAQVIRSVPQGLGKGLIWWEPAWIPAPGSGWATEAALKYLGEEGPGGNEWANQALFDYSGNALPALRLMKDL